MEQIDQLRAYGLFDARVPRYTSYPPANHFAAETDASHQSEWLHAVPYGAEVSIYIHIPFCKRLCWFCACRTQGTKTLWPVDVYVNVLLQEIALVAQRLPDDVRMARLHLGGGTPTILSPQTMTRLLSRVFDTFQKAEGFEFSVEIDPTEAATELLETLAAHGMNRASIGVQDFNPKVQEAIGRVQTYEQTHDCIEILRGAKVHSLNMDLLYGLPHQTQTTLVSTLEQVLALQPDRLALYGYAHVPWMSKRQVMIDSEALPSAEARYALTETAQRMLVMDGFRPIGIDHFARPGDNLALASHSGGLRRNFQGYTDDRAAVLIGLGASAISQFPQGYVQNRSATAAYTSAIGQGCLAGARGHVLSAEDRLTARMIEHLMCRFGIDVDALDAEFPQQRTIILQAVAELVAAYPAACRTDGTNMQILRAFAPLVRVIAGHLDRYRAGQMAHSSAI
ncbi:oxygen-independent coproporphyrinogen-III oxidase [Pseudosulfitobacter pseudonitzschiae]|uniref:Coproporphyrinogen-III oxidase n=1 Tax=Pseudosulfitobacter pseudonitzschiae TaxID=1402135 RepID=A0A221JZK5_9RHOB|nr:MULTISPECIES: oxygen-independent coproporphyrinogen III oxidase [Roseobacteraceae]ASM72165.1 oxygen-independent coproporphyrinogen-III oxidase [Pseudosulfitobacter pseudonitzschiae]